MGGRARPALKQSASWAVRQARAAVRGGRPACLHLGDRVRVREHVCGRGTVPSTAREPKLAATVQLSGCAAVAPSWETRPESPSACRQPGTASHLTDARFFLHDHASPPERRAPRACPSIRHGPARLAAPHAEHLCPRQPPPHTGPFPRASRLAPTKCASVWVPTPGAPASGSCRRSLVNTG